MGPSRVPFGNQLVDEIEHVYYSWNAPTKGGPQLTSLPPTGAAAKAPREAAAVAAADQAGLRAPAARRRGLEADRPAGPGRPTGARDDFRTELDYPRIVAYVAWFDHTRTALAFYPGRYEPPNAAVRGPMMVPYDQRWRLLATFNGGFIYSDVNNGSTDNGRINEPLADGNATLIGYRDGRVEIVRWSGGPNAGPNVAWARQSLPPIIWNGRLNPASERQLAVGLHARQRRPRLAHRRRHRPSRQPDLRSRGRPDRDHAGPRSCSVRARFARWSSTSIPNGTP